MALTKAHNRMIAGAVVNVKDYGAIGDDSTDDTAAIQTAIDYIWGLDGITNKRPALYFPAGTYKITSDLYLSIKASGDEYGFHMFGDGLMHSCIKAYTGVSTACFHVKATSTTENLRRIYINDMKFAGSDIAPHAIYAPYMNHSVIENVMIQDTLTSAIRVGFGFCNIYRNIELNSNSGDGLVLTENSAHNEIHIDGVKAWANDGFGIRLKNSLSAKFTNCLLETNKKGGIFLEAHCKGTSIDTCYFEANCTDGHTFTDPASTLVKASIIINGTNDTQIRKTYPCSVEVSNCTVQENAADYFIWAPGSIYGLNVHGNRLELGTLDLVTTYGAASGTASYGAIDKCIIGENHGFTNTFDITPMTYGLLNYKSYAQNIVSFDEKDRNIIDSDMSTWANIGTISGGSWQRSSVEFDDDPEVPVWEIDWSTANANSHIFGRTLDASEFPNLSGKLVMFCCWTKHQFDASVNRGSAAIYFGVSTKEGDATHMTNNDWEFRSVVIEWPGSGTIKVGLTNFHAAAVGGTDFATYGNIQVALPIVCELGADVKALQGAIGNQRTFYGSSAAPTDGTWKKGDIAWNSSAAAGGDPCWVCVSAGSPGTWKAMANLDA